MSYIIRLIQGIISTPKLAFKPPANIIFILCPYDEVISLSPMENFLRL